MSWTLFTANILVKGFVILGVATLMTLALRRASAAARHAVWALALLSLLALPFLSSALPSWRMPVPEMLLPVAPSFEAPRELNPMPLPPKLAAAHEPAARHQAKATASSRTPITSPQDPRPSGAPSEPSPIQSSMTWQTWDPHDLAGRFRAFRFAHPRWAGSKPNCRPLGSRDQRSLVETSV